MKYKLSAVLMAVSMLLAACNQVSPVETPDNSAPAEKPTTQKEEQTAELTVSQPVENDEIKFEEIKKVPLVNIYSQEKIKELGTVYLGNSTTPEDTYVFYDLGQIKIEPYKNWRFYMFNLACEGMCAYPYFLRTAYNADTKELVLLAKNGATEVDPKILDAVFTKQDKTLVLNTLKAPESITLPGGSKAVLQNADYLFAPAVEKASYDNGFLSIVLFTDPVYGDIYSSEPSGCLYLKMPDGSLSRYYYDPKLSEGSIKFTDGSSDGDVTVYQLEHGGCGLDGGCYWLTSIKDADVQLAGKSTAGVDLYMAKDLKQYDVSNTEVTDTLNEASRELNTLYYSYKATYEYTDPKPTEKPLTWEQFVAKKPILYWKDPFNRWSSINLASVQPAAECGKPVIYLYPEKTTDVNVQVGIDEFTKTIPEYGNGWTVRAEPNGVLFNYADGQTYPYLFWEGTTDKSVTVDQGFSIAKSDLMPFLDTSLTKLGLNSQEKSDFIEFWYPKMMASNEPYFLIRFVGTADFNKVAPLTISPKPDTLIRVFMSYMPMWEKVNIVPQQLSAPARNGFTVIEWGGTSSAPWQVQ